MESCTSHRGTGTLLWTGPQGIAWVGAEGNGIWAEPRVIGAEGNGIWAGPEWACAEGKGI